jgi:hypothetical protein
LEEKEVIGIHVVRIWFEVVGIVSASFDVRYVETSGSATRSSVNFH